MFQHYGASSEKRDILVSADAGQTWGRPDPLPADCTNGVRGFAGGQGVIVVGTRTHACVSSDGGTSFTAHPLNASLDSNLFFDGQQFIGWSRGKVVTSADGVTWSEQDTSPANLHIGAVSRSETTGTYVAARGGWKNWYERQEFYRSADGVTWTKLDASAYTGSHPIRYMTFGLAPAGTVCPTR